MTTELVEELAATPQGVERLSAMSAEEKALLFYRWDQWARPAQMPPAGDWRIWLFVGGRGAGKTRAGAEWIRQQVESGACRRLALVAPTAADARDVMIEGESGLLEVCPSWELPFYEPSKRRLTWANGAIATTFSAEEPARLRGPQFDGAWADELAFWRYPQAWDNLLMGLRLGTDPRCAVTTTPRPIPIVKALLSDPTVTVTRSTTYENQENLAEAFVTHIIARYQGTRIGRQELLAELVEDLPGALWARAWIDAARRRQEEVPKLSRIVVSIDPAISDPASAKRGQELSEAGIVVAGRDSAGHGWVLADLSLRASPDGWARRAVAAYRDFQADRVVAEANQGGEMVALTLRTVSPSVPVKLVHASRGKRTRAEPVAALYEQGKIHHVGNLASLEDQLCLWTPEDPWSPDRLDALVHALTELLLDQPAPLGTPIGLSEPGSSSYWGMGSGLTRIPRGM